MGKNEDDSACGETRRFSTCGNKEIQDVRKQGDSAREGKTEIQQVGKQGDESARGETRRWSGTWGNTEMIQHMGNIEMIQHMGKHEDDSAHG